MRKVRPASVLAKTFILMCVFSAGAASHWTYVKVSEYGGVGALRTAVVACFQQRATSAMARRLPLAQPDARAKDIAAAPAGQLRPQVRTPATAAPPAAKSPHELQNGAKPAVSERNLAAEISGAAAVGEPMAPDTYSLAMAAMHTQALKASLTVHAVTARLERNLKKEHARVLAMAEREIDKVAGVAAPPPSLKLAFVAPVRPIAGAAPAIASAPKPQNDAVEAIRRSAGPAAGAPPVAAPGQVLAYAPLPPANPAVAKSAPARDEPVKETKAAPEEMHDLTGVREALAAYKKGDLQDGDAHARQAKGEVASAALDWAAVRLQPRKAGFTRIMAFLDKYPDWPHRDWLLWRAEQSLFVDKPAHRHAAVYFSGREPASPIGHLVLARELVGKGDKKKAKAVVVDVWRNKTFGKWLESIILKEFGSLLTQDDHKHRADRLFYKERYKDSLRAAGKAGKEVYALAAARITVARGVAPEKAGAKLSAKLRKDPTWLFASVQRLRRADKLQDASKLLLGFNAPVAELLEPSAWWLERRMIARKLLDSGDAKTAYKVAAWHSNLDGVESVDAEFYAGFLALRFLDKPEQALAHFSRALQYAETPISRARAAYWQARAAERGLEPEDAERLYAIAAGHSATYYGQLARARLYGASNVPVRRAEPVKGAQRALAVRTVELLMQAGADEIAQPLSYALARTLKDRRQIAALGGILKREKNARGSLIVGKLAGYRGIELDDVAFPVFGVPKYTPLANSVDRSVVLSIARQESAFQTSVVSRAGAKGLMQMLTSTARRTAQRKGVPFDADRLLKDPAFNAQLGAAHLGDLMGDHPGSLILVFAAYNAGGGRVNQWIKAYGDPRKPGVDPIDWVERIPFEETRNYVQRVTENLGVYRSLLKSYDLPHPAISDLRAFAA
ncbi:MAG: lytic transglycosylase domain-containing protein, partial [Beijerinckiaceae bacterium]